MVEGAEKYSDSSEISILIIRDVCEVYVSGMAACALVVAFHPKALCIEEGLRLLISGTTLRRPISLAMFV